MTTPLPTGEQKTLAERLGHAASDRLLILPADDAGMCHSANPTPHMGTLFRAPFYAVYTRVAREMGIMPMLLAPTPQRIEQARQAGIDALATHEALRQQGFLFLDTLNTGARGDTLEARR